MDKLRHLQLATAIYQQLNQLTTIAVFCWDRGSPELKEALGKMKVAAQEVVRITGEWLEENK